MPVGHLVLKIYVPCKNFHMPCKASVYCWKNKYMPILKNHLPSRACTSNRKNYVPWDKIYKIYMARGMRARLNVKPSKVNILAVDDLGSQGISSHGIEPVEYVQTTNIMLSMDNELTHCSLVTPYGDRDMGQHWLRQWLVAWRHQAITWTNVDLSSDVATINH